ncbi:MAG TPA: hypothetical protein VIL16_31125 [Trebonia sp.]
MTEPALAASSACSAANSLALRSGRRPARVARRHLDLAVYANV